MPGKGDFVRGYINHTDQSPVWRDNVMSVLAKTNCWDQMWRLAVYKDTACACS